jgi:hypothetical protein
MKDYPTPWQRQMMWAALTACFVVILVVILAAVIWIGASIISFLQPILIPVAIAAILAYLLDPLLTKMSRRTLTRTKAIALLFAIAFFALGSFVDPCVGFDQGWSNRSAPRSAAYCDAESSIRTLRLGSASAESILANRNASHAGRSRITGSSLTQQTGA